MAMNDRTARTILQYIVDASGLRVGERALAALDLKQEQVNDSLREFETNATRADRAARNLAAGQTTLAKASTGGGTRQQSRAETLDKLGSFGSQFFGGVGSGELGNAAGLIGDLAGAVGNLGPIAVGTTAVMAGLAIVTAEYNRILERGKQQLQGAIAAQSAYYNALGTQTEEQVRESLAQLERVRPALQAQAEEARRVVDEAFRVAEAQVGRAGAQILFATGAFSQLEEAAKNAETALATNVQTATRYEQGLQAGAFAANEATKSAAELAAAEMRLAAERQNAINAAIAQGTELNRLRREGTTEQVQSQLARIEDERAAIMARLADYTSLTTAEMITLQQRLQELSASSAQLTDSVLPVIAARERERARLKDFADTARLVVDNLKTAADANKKITELRAGARSEITKVLTDASARESELTRETTLRRADILYKAGREEIKATADNLRERAKIERDFSRSFLSAVARRDALAATEAKRQRADSLAELSDNAAAERAQRREGLREQLREVDNNQREQILKIREGARAQIATIQERLNREVQAQQLIMQQAGSAIRQRVLIETAGYQQSLSAAAAFVGGLVSLFSGRFAATPARPTSVTNNIQVSNRGSTATETAYQLQRALERR